MKILVTAKRVPDNESTIKVNPEGTGIVESGLKWVVNPFDEIAVEEALRIKEAQGGVEVIVVTVGPSEAQEQLRTTLAMGADRAILVKAERPDPTVVARILVKVIEKEQPAFVLMGKQATDDDSNEVGQMLAQLLGWPQATFISKLTLSADKTSATLMREVDGGMETVEVPLPAIITNDLRLNEPRYASLPGIMKARKKPLEEIDAASLGVDLTPRLRIRKVTPPPARSAGRKVDSVDELLRVLQSEAKVL
ncbi:MAG TPA: electron transfer flavoprotein subunit beta/FixA family protein [Candidatus Limnocylindrales bacterium]|nr:electron transfer flavoprotein subunit beta/FixA family protein [Candidatus Limnocylindrales bacterium]